MEATVDTGISGAGSRDHHWYESSSSTGSSQASWWHDTNWFRVAQQTQQQINTINQYDNASADNPINDDMNAAVEYVIHGELPPKYGNALLTNNTVAQLNNQKNTVVSDDTDNSNSDTSNNIGFRAMLRNQNTVQSPRQQLLDQLQPIVNQSNNAHEHTTAAVEWHPTDKQLQRYGDAADNIRFNNLYNSVGSGDSAQYAGGASGVMNRFNTKSYKRNVITTQQRVKSIRVHALESLAIDIRKQIEECIVLPLLQPNLFSCIGVKPACGVILSGSSGSGKTQIMSKLLKELGIYHHQFDASQLLVELESDTQAGGNSEHTGNIITNMFNVALKYAPSVILIDDIDIIAGMKKHDESSTITKIRGLLKSSMDSLSSQISSNKPVIVIGTTSVPDNICQSLTRVGRFDKHIRLTKPNIDSRLAYLKQLTSNMKLALNVDLRTIAAQTVGYVASDLANLCSEAGLVCIRQQLHYTIDTSNADNMSSDIPESISSDTIDHMTIAQQHFLTALKLCKPSSTRGVADAEIPNVQWNDIGGQDALRNALTETIQWPLTFPHIYKSAGIAPSTGVLLWGPPGCGKTLLAQAVATECQASFISVKGPELLSPYIGQSESNIRELFTRARASAPCVIFLDEIDSIGRSRASNDQNHDSTSDRVLTQILTELDTRLTQHDDRHKQSINDSSNSTVFVIAATNRPEVLDAALIRPGRFDELVYVGLPSLDGRLAVLKACLLRTPLNQHIINNQHQYLHSLAERTDGFSGADLANLCRMATKLAIQRHIKHQTELNTNLNDDNDSSSIQPNNQLQQVLGSDLVEIEHFERALLLCRPSVGQAELKRYALFAESLAENQRTLPSKRNNKMSSNDNDDKKHEDNQMDESTDVDTSASGKTRDQLLSAVSDTSTWRNTANNEIQQNKALKRGIINKSTSQSGNQQALHNIIQAFQLYKKQQSQDSTASTNT